jgi:microcin C transport system substrate-binding protein
MALQFARFRALITLAALSAIVSSPTIPAIAGAEGTKKHHALSLIGTPKFPADYPHFDWVNPDAPKGGTLRQQVTGTFDNLNPFTIKGDTAAGMGELFDTLMAPSPDEPATQYGLIAEWASYPDDYSSVTFKIRDGAKFHDGSPITPEDVIYSLEAMKEADPRRKLYWKNVVKGEKTGEREVTFFFDVKGNRELPFITGELMVMSKAYWTGRNANGELRDVTKTTLEPPVGSGPYRIKSFEAGRRIVLERVKDYWALGLPVVKGQSNFDEIVFVYFLDDTAPFEEFKAGRIDIWPESSAANWANRYAFDAAKSGQVKKELLPHKRVAGMQAFVFNTRRAQFQDVRVRKALGLTFNFEAANKNRFYGAYIRAQSYFDNSEFAAKGLPEGRELEILNTVKDSVPPEVFTTPYATPSAPTDADHRKNMGEAFKLLQAAGWTVKDAQLRDAAGKTLDAEFLLVQPNFEAVVLPFIADLKKLGVNASVRVVDTSQYKRRIDQHDFDIIVDSFGQSHSPGNEQRDYWGSAAADKEGSNNTIGIKNPAIDKLIDHVIFAKDRDELVSATRALDRVLLWNYYVIPQWYFPYDRVAIWDVFGRPAKLPSQLPFSTSAWWIEPEKEKALVAVRGR